MSAALYWLVWYVLAMAGVLSLSLVQPKTER